MISVVWSVWFGCIICFHVEVRELQELPKHQDNSDPMYTWLGIRLAKSTLPQMDTDAPCFEGRASVSLPDGRFLQIPAFVWIEYAVARIWRCSDLRDLPMISQAYVSNMYVYIYMAGVQNSRSKGSYKVGPIGIEKLILHLRYEAGPIGNHAVPKLGASIALAWR